MKTWFSVKAAAEGSPAAEVAIFDDIGAWGVSAKDFLDAIKPFRGQDLNVKINSLGGDVFAGVAIYNGLRSHAKDAKVTTINMAIAASAANVIFMAGDHRVMPANTMQMAHNPWTFAAGNADELRETADVLDKIGSTLSSIYVARTGMSEDEVKAMLAEDSWFTAEEALEAGLVDEITPAFEVHASYDLDRLPAKARALFQAAPKPVSTLVGQIKAALGKAGLGEFLDVFLTDPDIVDGSGIQAAVERVTEVQELCAALGKDERFAGFVRERLALAKVREVLAAEAAAADDKTRVDTARRASTLNRPASGADYSPTELWAQINEMNRRSAT